MKFENKNLPDVIIRVISQKCRDPKSSKVSGLDK